MSDNAAKTASANLGDIGAAYALAIDVVASAAARVEGKFARLSDPSERKDSILAGFLVGLTLVECAILGGYNPQASALVRQELEAIAALEELRQGCRKDGTTPNIRHVPSVPGSIYGDLSQASHFSHSGTLQSLTTYRGEVSDAPGPTRMWLLSPQHLPTETARLLALHTLLILHFAEHQSEHYAELHGHAPTASELAGVAEAIQLLRRAGAIEGDA